jgi:adenylate cyclase
VRLNAQLIDAETGNHLWAERYDRDLADIFAVQTEIAAAVMTAIAPAIADAELRRALRKPPESLGAWEAYQRGLWHLRRFNEADFEWAKKFFQQAIKLESMFAAAYLGIAQIYTWEGGVLFKRPIDEALKLARENIRRALEIDPDDPLAQATLAIHMSSPGSYEAALEQAQQALKRNPNLMQAHQAKGMALLFGGRPAEGREALRECLRLSPRDQQRPLILCQVAMSYYFEGEYERAAGAAQHVVIVYPDHPWAYRWLAAALGQLGRVNEAHDALCTALTVSPNSFEQSVRNRNPWVRPVDYEHMLDGLRKAGWQG